MDWVGEFFGAMPEVGAAVWEFIRGWAGLAIIAGSAVLTALYAGLALKLRDHYGWLSAIFGSLAALIVLWWFFGIIPSAWIYFADGRTDLLGGTVIPTALPGMSNFYEVFRDLVVIAEQGIATLGLVVVALQIQKRFPKALAEGEESRPQSGGYK